MSAIEILNNLDLIKDNGKGMTKEQMERCFEPFYTSKNTDINTGIGYDGSGFGLSLSYTILRQHDGMLLVHSEVGRGTEFNLYIPLSNLAKAEQLVDPTHNTNLIKHNALIIDSEKNAPLAIQATLDSLAISYEVFTDKNKALEKIAKKNSSITMLIVDLDCMDLLTINTLVEIAKDNINLKIILTTSSTKLFADKFQNLPNIRIIEKPLGVWAVHNTVRKLLFVDNNSIINNYGF
jgi:CheY-like chemotaxis protein